MKQIIVQLPTQFYTHTYFSPRSLCMKNSDDASYIVTIALEPFLDGVLNAFRSPLELPWTPLDLVREGCF